MAVIILIFHILVGISLHKH